MTLAPGVASLDNLSPAQRAYSEKVRAKLEENARRLRGELLEATRLYKRGILAYSKGMYDDSVKWMEAALEETDAKTMLGGQIQIQMALALDAYGQRDRALEVYTHLVERHPEQRIKKQAVGKSGREEGKGRGGEGVECYGGEGGEC